MVIKSYYELATDTIHGCKKYSLTWWYEMGHRDWYKRGIEQAMKKWQFYLTIGAVFLITQSKFIIAELLIYIVIILIFVSEVHAWKYGFKYKKRYKKLMRDK